MSIEKLGEFTDWARDQRDDLVALQADIELERLTDIEAIYDRVGQLATDAVAMVEVAILHDDEIEDALDNPENDVTNTLVTRLEAVIRDLEFAPETRDSIIVQELRDAVSDWHQNNSTPNLIPAGVLL